jgi:hypothetical protein
MNKKRRVIFAFIIFVCSLFLALNLISSFEIELNKEKFYRGQTLIAKFPDSFISSFNLENIGIYAEDSIHKSPVEAGLVRIGSEYVYYATLPITDGNYVLKIKDASYYDPIYESKEEINKSFSISSSNTSYIAVNPGAINANSEIKLRIKNYGSSQEVDVSLKEADFNEKIKLNYNQEETIFIPIASVKSLVKSYIKVGEYNLPVIINPIKNNTIKNGTIIVIEDFNDSIFIEPNKLNMTILEDKDQDFQIIINNIADSTFKNISIKTDSKSITVKPILFDLYAERTINLTINADEDEETKLEIKYGNNTFLYPISIKITKKETEVKYNYLPENEKKTCSENGWKICLENEECKNGVLKQAMGQYCCTGECKSKKSTKNWAIGLVILIILSICGYFLYNKYKNHMPEKAENILKKRTENYKERLSLVQTKDEVSGKLSKI